MNILFVTHNKNKVAEFSQILEGVATIVHVDEEYQEIQADDVETVALESAKRLAKQHGRPIVCEDAGLFITALNGFPGVYSGPIHKQIGLKGVLTLMQDATDRSCVYKSAVGYCEPGKEPYVFVGEEKGEIALAIRGTNGFGHDPIFIPYGFSTTYGEMDDYKEHKQFRRRAVLKLLAHLRGEP